MAGVVGGSNGGRDQPGLLSWDNHGSIITPQFAVLACGSCGAGSRDIAYTTDSHW